MDYDTHLFIEIIESVQGVTFIRSDCVNEVHCRFYEGVNGKFVMIETTDEWIDDETAKKHLIKLGLEHLIVSMFPIQNVVEKPEEIKFDAKKEAEG